MKQEAIASLNELLTIINDLDTEIEKKQSFLNFMLELEENQEYDRWLALTKNNNIPEYIEARARREAEKNNTLYGRELLNLRIKFFKKKIKELKHTKNNKIRLYEQLNSQIIVEEPKIEPNKAKIAPIKKITKASKKCEGVSVVDSPKTNSLEHCPILQAIGSPLTLEQAQSNIKQILVAIHPDKQKPIEKEAYRKVYSKVTEMGAMLEEDWELFNPLVNHSSEHIAQLMTMPCALSKYDFQSRLLNN